MNLDKRQTDLERGRVMAAASSGGQVHQVVEHIAVVLDALEVAGVIHYPNELPEIQKVADMLRQLDDLRDGNE